MKRIPLLAIALFLAGVTLHAQQLRKVIELKMPGTETDGSQGTRGAAVAWHPVTKKYYASYAGNANYPIGVFDDKGKLTSDPSLTTGVDTRGLWYSPVTKLIYGNGYSENGWFAYHTDEKGSPVEVATIFSGLYQPNEQCAGTFHPIKKQVMFLQGSQVLYYSTEGVFTDSTMIHWGRTKTQGPGVDDDPQAFNEAYNLNTFGYTGIAGQEFAFLNIEDKQVELYDAASGYMVKKLKLPAETLVTTMFNFSVANGTYFVFDESGRKWVGFK